jgi:hypothetical protein
MSKLGVLKNTKNPKKVNLLYEIEEGAVSRLFLFEARSDALTL